MENKKQTETETNKLLGRRDGEGYRVWSSSQISSGKTIAEWSEHALNSPKITSYLLLLNIFSSSQWETLQGEGKVLRRIFKDLKTRRNYSDRRWTTKCASHSVFFNLYVITTHNYIKNHGSKQSYS